MELDEDEDDEFQDAEDWDEFNDEEGDAEDEETFLEDDEDDEEEYMTLTIVEIQFENKISFLQGG